MSNGCLPNWLRGFDSRRPLRLCEPRKHWPLSIMRDMAAARRAVHVLLGDRHQGARWPVVVAIVGRAVAVGGRAADVDHV